MEVTELIMTLDAGKDRLAYATFLVDTYDCCIDFSLCPSCAGIAIPEEHTEEGCCSVCKDSDEVVEIGYMGDA